MKSLPTIWLDLDGTLIDVKRRFTSVHERICQLMDIVPMAPDEYWACRCKGVPTSAILARINAGGRENEYYLHRNELLESVEMLELDQLRSGCKELFQNTPGSRFSLLTGRKDTVNLWAQLKWLNLYDFFDEIVVVSPFGDWQDKYEALKSRRVPDTCWMIGDTARDITAGRQTGMHTIGVKGGMSTRERLLAEEPEYVVDELSEIPAIVRAAC